MEQFRWNKWVKNAETEGTGESKPSNYQAKISLHSGENTFRVKQIDYTGIARISKSAAFSSAKPAITFSPTKADKIISFSGETLYEIFDRFGTRVKTGSDNKIDVQSLAKGAYFLNYDNTAGEFLKV